MNHLPETNEDARLKGLLREARPAPDLPPRFQESVWRRLERQAAPAASSIGWLDRLVGLFLRPQFAMGSLALLLVIGSLTALPSGVQNARQAARERYLASVAPYPLR
jgi:hypothetical protein